LAVSATAPGAGAIVITGKVTGNCSKDIICQIKLGQAATGTETVVGAIVPTHLTGGTTDPDLTTILTKIAGTEYHFIVPCLSNTDATDIVATPTNLKRIRTHIELYNTGLNAKLQQVVYGITGSNAGADGLAVALAAAPHTNAGGNVVYGEMVLCMMGRDLPGVVAAREAIGRVVAESLDPAANRIGEQMPSLYGALDLNTDKPTTAEIETALNAGVAIMSYTAQGIPYIVRPITTHSQDATGAPDVRCLDVQNVSGFYVPIRGIRDDLPLAFPNAKLVADTIEGTEPPPKGVTEERDIRAWIDERMRFWGREGVWSQAKIEDAILTGKRVVQVNSTDATQVDIVVPATVVPGLAKFGVYGMRVPS
jgi:phage tail sheath gpL-like